MSNYYKRKMALAGVDFSDMLEKDLRALIRKILAEKIHGISFSPYVQGQGPGTQLEAEQIRSRLAIIQPHVSWIRSFSCTEGNELIPAIAKKEGLKTMVGAWLGDDKDKNELEIKNAIEIGESGQAEILAVGNEVLLRGDLTEDELLDYMHRVKRAVPGVDVGYVDAYFEFVDHPRITEACDVILANCYPFWEGCPADHALLYMKDMYQRVSRVAEGKRVIVSETGWPNVGTAEEGAVPSLENAMRYFINTCKWAEEDDVEVFYFSSFDEAWKVDAEGDVGAYWGLWDKDGQAKYV